MEISFKDLVMVFIVYSLLGFIHARRATHAMGQFIYLDSYVATIDTPHYGNQSTKNLLVEFNNMSTTKESVFFKDEHVLFTREIHITEASELPKMTKEKDLITVGLTHNDRKECNIQIVNDLSLSVYRTTLFHEYCHCMGYPDLYENKYKNNLMYYEENTVDENSIKWYSEEIGDKVHKWKNFLNWNSNIQQTK